MNNVNCKSFRSMGLQYFGFQWCHLDHHALSVSCSVLDRPLTPWFSEIRSTKQKWPNRQIFIESNQSRMSSIPRLNTSPIAFCSTPLPRNCSHINVLLGFTFSSSLPTNHDHKVLPEIFAQLTKSAACSPIQIGAFISSSLLWITLNMYSAAIDYMHQLLTQITINTCELDPLPSVLIAGCLTIEENNILFTSLSNCLCIPTP